MSDIKSQKSSVIAIVDDEPDILALVIVHLKQSGFQTEAFSDPESFFVFLQRKKPDLLVLDLMLPGADGFEICKTLRNDPATRSMPIIILTARTGETDKVLGLELGADDYVTKPFSPKELVARIKAVLRRRDGRPEEEVQRIKVGDVLDIDLERHEVRVAGNKIDLTSTEFNILTLLAKKPGRVFTRDQVLDHVWGHDKVVLDRTVDVHIKNLRDKLGSASDLIQNIRGVGYKLEP